MRFKLQTTTLVLFGSQVLSREHLPVKSRRSQHGLINDASYLGLLSRRDECSEAFGANAQNSNCAPNRTLCCTRDSQEFPSCEKHFGYGWCCVEEDGNCYVDLESVCGQEGSVQCTNLKAGTSDACCLRSTSCEESIEASEQLVRCNINRGDLLAFETATAEAQEEETTTASAILSTSTSSTSIADKSTTTESESQTHEQHSSTSVTSSSATTSSGRSSFDSSSSKSPSTGSSSPGLSSGAVAGIVFGAVAGGIAMAFLAFWLLRRKGGGNNQVPPQQANPESYDTQPMKEQQGLGHQELDAQEVHYRQQPSVVEPAELG